jgi:hypothetical protein
VSCGGDTADLSRRANGQRAARLCSELAARSV